MKSTVSLNLGLGLGLASYCLVLLISREAAVSALMLMGTMALTLIFISMWLLWVHMPNVRCATDSLHAVSEETEIRKVDQLSDSQETNGVQ